MSDYYSVVFRGDLVIGKSIAEAKANLAKIFKTNEARINALFSGKAQALKRKLSLTEAQRYQKVLQQAGVLVSIEAEAEKEKVEKETLEKKSASETPLVQSSSVDEKQTAVAKKLDQSESSSGQWQLAPPGSLLGEKQQPKQQEAINIATDHLHVMPQEGNLIKDDERLPPPEADIDVEILDWELTPYGEALLKESERSQAPTVEVDTSALALAEQEGNLITESERPVVAPREVDTSHLQLVSEDSSEEQKQP